jgi:hypothetical protein
MHFREGINVQPEFAGPLNKRDEIIITLDKRITNKNHIHKT